MREELNGMDAILKKVAVQYFYIIIAVFSIYSVFFWIKDLSPYQYLTTFCAFLHLMLAYIPYKLEYKDIKPLISLYLVLISVALYPFVYISWETGRATTFIWYFLIPIACMVFFSTKTVIKWTVYILVLLFSTLLISNILPTKGPITFTDPEMTVMNLLTIVFCLLMVLFFLYYINKINQLKVKENITSGTQREEVEVDEKFKNLFDNILDYFEAEKPYCDPDFAISQLADKMNTNITYISRAIKTNGNTNFNVFINIYRISLVKKMLNDDYQNKYTIKYIYTSAGFRHQSTFNKVFKQIEGVTPSEFIKEIHKQKGRSEKMIENA